jgi:hypothetical protein
MDSSLDDGINDLMDRIVTTGYWSNTVQRQANCSCSRTKAVATFAFSLCDSTSPEIYSPQSSHRSSAFAAAELKAFDVHRFAEIAKSHKIL